MNKTTTKLKPNHSPPLPLLTFSTGQPESMRTERERVTSSWSSFPFTSFMLELTLGGLQRKHQKTSPSQ